MKKNKEMTTRMRMIFGSALVAALLLSATAPAEDVRRLFAETPEQKTERLAWWTHDRFGLFVHFGLYAIPARGEWIKKIETIPEAKYLLYFENFNPDRFDAQAWAKAAKAAGMKYAVLTAKHHEGFCLWDTKFTDYKITNTAFKRDLVKEFVAAFRAEGLRVGFYYSLIDWHHPDFTIDSKHPRRPKWANDCGTFGDADADYPELNRSRDMAKYRAYMKDQVRELLTGYGPIDILWFDFTYEGEHGKSAADWDSEGLLRLARAFQPQIIVNNRLGLGETTADGWDFVTPEQFRVEEWPTVRGVRVPWETCQTFSGSWGYARDEMTWKDTPEIVTLLADTVSKGGNLIMNVGPTARGRFDARAVARLSAVGAWLDDNGRSIYGCTQAPARFTPPENTRLTYNPKSNRLYVHLLAWPGQRLNCAFPEEVAFASFLHDGSEIELERHGVEITHSQKMYRTGCEGVAYFKLPAVRPAVVNPVIEVVLNASREVAE